MTSIDLAPAASPSPQGFEPHFRRSPSPIPGAAYQAYRCGLSYGICGWQSRTANRAASFMAGWHPAAFAHGNGMA